MAKVLDLEDFSEDPDLGRVYEWAWRVSEVGEDSRLMEEQGPASPSSTVEEDEPKRLEAGDATTSVAASMLTSRRSTRLSLGASVNDFPVEEESVSLERGPSQEQQHRAAAEALYAAIERQLDAEELKQIEVREQMASSALAAARRHERERRRSEQERYGEHGAENLVVQAGLKAPSERTAREIAILHNFLRIAPAFVEASRTLPDLMERLKSVARLATLELYAADTFLFHQGDTLNDRTMKIVVHGHVRLRHADNAKPFATLSRGEVMDPVVIKGEGRPYSATATVNRTAVLCIDQEVYKKHLSAYHRVKYAQLLRFLKLHANFMPSLSLDKLEMMVNFCVQKRYESMQGGHDEEYEPPVCKENAVVTGIIIVRDGLAELQRTIVSHRTSFVGHLLSEREEEAIQVRRLVGPGTVVAIADALQNQGYSGTLRPHQDQHVDVILLPVEVFKSYLPNKDRLTMMDNLDLLSVWKPPSSLLNSDLSAVLRNSRAQSSADSSLLDGLQQQQEQQQQQRDAQGKRAGRSADLLSSQTSRRSRLQRREILRQLEQALQPHAVSISRTTPRSDVTKRVTSRALPPVRDAKSMDLAHTDTELAFVPPLNPRQPRNRLASSLSAAEHLNRSFSDSTRRSAQERRQLKRLAAKRTAIRTLTSNGGVADDTMEAELTLKVDALAFITRHSKSFVSSSTPKPK